jgi:hypothetical protein
VRDIDENNIKTDLEEGTRVQNGFKWLRIGYSAGFL